MVARSVQQIGWRGIGLAWVMSMAWAAPTFAEPTPTADVPDRNYSYYIASASDSDLPGMFVSLADDSPPSEAAQDSDELADSPPEIDSTALHAHARSALRWQKPKHAKYRMKVVNYKRSLLVGNEDVVMKLVSPGKRRSLMSLEFKF
jgi:hypothetical protein